MTSVIINGIFLSFLPFKHRLWKGMCIILIITTTFLSLFAIYQYTTGHSSFSGRAHATFVNPNSFSGYLLLTMPLLIGLYLLFEKIEYAALFFVLTMLSFAALLATGTGGRWLFLIASIAVALLLFWLFIPKHKARLKILIIGFFTVLLLFFTPLGTGSSIFSPKQEEISGLTIDRLNIWQSTWEIIKGHPIRGVGFWNFHTIYSKYKNPAYKNVEHYFSHNDYLQLWAELGIIGLAIFLILIYVYFRQGIRCLKYLASPSSHPSPAHQVGGEGGSYIMLLPALIGSFLMLIHTIGDFDLYIPSILFLFWGYIAYAISAAGDLGLHKKIKIDLDSFKIFARLGKNKLYILAFGIFAFSSIWLFDPYLASLYSERGKGYLAAGEYEKAQKYFKKAIDIDPVDDSHHFNLGLALSKLSNDPTTLQMAEQEMKKAMHISPYRADIYFNMANFYRQFYLKDKGYLAVEMLKKAMELDPVDKTLNHNLGVLYLQMGLYKDAIIEFKKYLEFKPDDFDTHTEIATAYMLNKDYDNAIKEADWFFKKENTKNYAHFLRGRILKQKGDYKEAYEEYKLAFRENGKEKEVIKEIVELMNIINKSP
ncbi:MAG: O-antigen ligase family protein [Deltaproteobacteria bacterium]|nr:O-antigen ligase family protein [Deltaproteobacteria bacterium]